MGGLCWKPPCSFWRVEICCELPLNVFSPLVVGGRRKEQWYKRCPLFTVNAILEPKKITSLKNNVIIGAMFQTKDTISNKFKI